MEAKPESKYKKMKRLASEGDAKAILWLERRRSYEAAWCERNRDKVNASQVRRNRAKGVKPLAEYRALVAANKLTPEDAKARQVESHKKIARKLSALVAKCNAGDLSEFNKLLVFRQKRKLINQKARARKRGDGELRGIQKTHCKRGHELSTANVYLSRRGDRECKTCSIARAAARRESKQNKQQFLSAPAAPVTV